jgi:hypothetical protein
MAAVGEAASAALIELTSREAAAAEANQLYFEAVRNLAETLSDLARSLPSVWATLSGDAQDELIAMNETLLLQQASAERYLQQSLQLFEEDFTKFKRAVEQVSAALSTVLADDERRNRIRDAAIMSDPKIEKAIKQGEKEIAGGQFTTYAPGRFTPV